MVLLVIGSGATTDRCESSVDIQIDLWNRHLTNNDVRAFPHEIKELSFELLFIVICRLFIFIVSSTHPVQMDVLYEPFLLRCNSTDSSCATSMFFYFDGYAELVFLALRLEFASLLFGDKIICIFNHSSNIRVGSDQLSIVICNKLTPDPVFRAQHATFKGIRYPSLTNVTLGFKVKLNAHSMCAHESSLYIHRTENGYRITNVTIYNIYY
jgi:hypothetical protein